jgi:DNA-binding GntR family transcriptional regulator
MAASLKLPNRGSGVYGRIREDVLNGRWKPGEKLQPVSLSARYESSTTVVREALTKLAGEKFVLVEPNRGFFVPRLSLDELRDLTEVRCVTEGLALELATQRGDLAWESELIAAHHTLSRTPRREHDDPQRVADDWADAHREFHSKLIEACRVPQLIELSRQLWDTTELYRRWAAPTPDGLSRDAEHEHAAILEATLGRESARASRLLREHYETTVDIVLRAGLVEGVEVAEQ